MLKRLRDFALLYSSLVRDPRTPARSKYLPWIALAYFIFPLDFIPDLLPVIGQTDDLIIVAMLIWLAVSAISNGQYEEHRRRQKDVIDIKPR